MLHNETFNNSLVLADHDYWYNLNLSETGDIL